MGGEKRNTTSTDSSWVHRTEFSSSLCQPGKGAEVITADGVDVVNGTDADALNAAFYPEAAGETHTFEVRDLGSSTVRTVSMTSASITKGPGAECPSA